MTVVSDVSPVDLLAELLDQIGNSLQARMDSERAAEHVERAFVVAEFLQDDAQAGERAEVSWLARPHLVNGGKGAAEILLGVVDGGAPARGVAALRRNV